MNEEMLKKTYALAFSGGGARGAYEMGVWKALNEMDIKIEAVAGTSIGSINGALLAQGDYEKALSVWNDITPDMVFDMELRGIKKYRDTAKMRTLLTDFIDEDKIRYSDIQFALVTYNLSDMRDETLFIEDIPKGKLIDYILASANYPLFKRHKIDGHYYIDGGVVNNLPAKPLADRGYENIIIVDIRDPLAMTYRKFDVTKHSIVNIKSRHDLHNVLNFAQEFIHDNLKKGYYDTYMVFGKYISSYYYIIDDDDDDYSINRIDLDQLFEDNFFKQLFRNDEAMVNLLEYMNDFMSADLAVSVKSKEFFICGLEICADILGVEKIREYTVKEFYDKLLFEIKDIVDKGKDIEDSIKKMIDDKISGKEIFIDAEDKKVLFAVLIKNVDKILYVYEPIVKIAPKIIIGYLFANILLNREKIK